MPRKPHIFASIRWIGTLLILKPRTIIGVVDTPPEIQPILVNAQWHAWGCLADWQDVDLGWHANKRDAQRATELWAFSMTKPRNRRLKEQ